MKTIDLKNLTNTELMAQQKIIKKILSLELSKLKKLKNQTPILKPGTSKLHNQYAQLSQELYIRTNGITKLKPYMPRKRRIVSETEKRIKQLIKEFGSKRLNVCLQRFN